MAEAPHAGPDPDPEGAVQRQLVDRRRTVARHDHRDRTLSLVRLAVFAVIPVLGWIAYGFDRVSWWWLALPAAAFLVLVLVHDRVVRARERAARAVRHYEGSLARMEDRWQGTGVPGDRYLAADHPYAGDLDLFGTGSLFELLCTARTRGGEETLAAWILEPAEPAEIRHRQTAVEELRPAIDLREDLAVMGEEVRAGTHPDRMRSWGEGKPILRRPFIRWLALLLAACNVGTLLAWWLAGTGPVPAVLSLLVSGTLALACYADVRAVIRSVEQPERELTLLSEILEILERGEFGAPRLQALRGELETGGLPPSARIRRLARLVELLHARQNQLFLPLSLLVFWGTQMAFAIESWRRTCGGSVGRWLEVVGEFEALCALAGYAFEHPADPFPEVVEPGPCFEGRALGHPLLPSGTCVPNDVRLDGELRLLVVSGSNMSGKSTLLRTVGVNAVLAQAGAPVRAERLRISPLSVGATIRILDSLQEGSSRFYTEIRRIREIMDLTGKERAVLFLLDEILHGTNSHDRAIGAEAIVRTLMDRHAVGLITTHDLALARVADELGHRAGNVHFEDRLEEGRMSFDYRLRPGVVRRSNALELMRSIGLDV